MKYLVSLSRPLSNNEFVKEFLAGYNFDIIFSSNDKAEIDDYVGDLYEIDPHTERIDQYLDHAPIYHSCGYYYGVYEVTDEARAIFKERQILSKGFERR